MAREDSEMRTYIMPMIKIMTVTDARPVIEEKIRSTGFFLLIVIAIMKYNSFPYKKKGTGISPAPFFC
jgi:hypothetical protein